MSETPSVSARGTDGSGQACPLTVTGAFAGRHLRPAFASCPIHAFCLVSTDTTGVPAASARVPRALRERHGASRFGMSLALLRLAGTVPAVVLGTTHLGHLLVTDRMAWPRQRRGQGPGALTYPAQRSVRTPSRVGLDHPLQRIHQLGITTGDPCPPRPRPTTAPRGEDGCCRARLHPPGDGLA